MRGPFFSSGPSEICTPPRNGAVCWVPVGCGKSRYRDAWVEVMGHVVVFSLFSLACGNPKNQHLFGAGKVKQPMKLEKKNNHIIWHDPALKHVLLVSFCDMWSVLPLETPRKSTMRLEALHLETRTQSAQYLESLEDRPIFLCFGNDEKRQRLVKLSRGFMWRLFWFGR